MKKLIALALATAALSATSHAEVKFSQGLKHHQVETLIPNLEGRLDKTTKDALDAFHSGQTFEASKLNPAQTGLLASQIIGYGTPADVERLVSIIGANPDIGGNETLLTLACLRSNTEVLNKLLACKSNPDQATKNGSTPLHTAAFRSSAKHVKILADATKNINAQDGLGMTALHNAVRSPFDTNEKVKILLDHKIDKTIKNKFNKTAKESLGVKQDETANLL